MRDASGSLMHGFMFRAGEPADCMLAELWAVLFGLKMCWDCGERRVCMESDAEMVVSLINNPIPTSHPDVDVIREIKAMLGRNWEVQLRWIPREANMAADYVAKQAFDAWPGLHQFHTAFADLATILEKDIGDVVSCSGVA
ncbi:hypothetical protein QN277_020424 [Acacia crassicarpa]|uniref:RNase H type-1 domain-containing protein n=1 Tax=Acacia crassicarpa TaxID=499986 RepID=A0AAE1JP35_9FABA|nr:hypothetical protein QN277_020424 [Acacia crassicarpa]